MMDSGSKGRLVSITFKKWDYGTAHRRGIRRRRRVRCKLPDIPGGARTFEFVAKFCYGVKLELSVANVVYLLCAAEHIEMTEEYGEGNLISQSETFLNQTVLRSWKDSLKALQTCDEVDILPYAKKLHIPTRCLDSLAAKACTDPALFGWPMMERGGPMQSPGGSVLWNGISTGARPKSTSLDWWYDNATSLSLSTYKKLVSIMNSRGIEQEIVAGSLISYVKKYLPGLTRHWDVSESSRPVASVSEEYQKLFLEEIDHLLPFQEGLVSTKFLFGLLRTAKILRASPSCLTNL